MRLYVDTSALGRAYLVDEPDGEELRSLIFGSVDQFATSELTLLEIASAFHRAVRAGRIPAADPFITIADADCSAGGRLATLPLDLAVLARPARQLLESHPLGAADAIHLATTIALRSDGVETGFVTRDRRQAEAARAEGFEVI